MPVVLAVAALLVAPPALGVLGTSLADVPYIGLATAYVPWYLPWLTVASVVGGVLAMIHWGLRRSRIAAVLAVEHAGADISLIDTFGLGAPKQAAPDDEATYATFEESRCGCASTARADPVRAHPFSSTSIVGGQHRLHAVLRRPSSVGCDPGSDRMRARLGSSTTRRDTGVTRRGCRCPARPQAETSPSTPPTCRQQAACVRRVAKPCRR